MVVIGISLLYLAVFFWRQPELWPTLLLALGLGVGMAWYWLDTLWLVKQYQPQDDPQLKPVTRSIWMLLTYWPLAIFVATSTGSVLGWGLVFGLGLCLTLDIFKAQEASRFKEVFNLPQKSALTTTEIQGGLAIWLLGLLTLAIYKVW